MGNIDFKILVIVLCCIAASPKAISQTTFIDAVAYLKTGDSIVGKTRVNPIYTKFIFKDEKSKKKLKLGPRDLVFIKTREEFPKELSYKIVEGKAAEPKIVQKIVDGNIS